VIDPGELLKDPTDLEKPNWRIGYQKMHRDVRTQLLEERRRNSTRMVRIPWSGKLRPVCNLTEAECNRLALLTAQRSTERGIREWAVAEKSRRGRQSQAL